MIKNWRNNKSSILLTLLSFCGLINPVIFNFAFAVFFLDVLRERICILYPNLNKKLTQIHSQKKWRIFESFCLLSLTIIFLPNRYFLIQAWAEVFLTIAISIYIINNYLFQLISGCVTKKSQKRMQLYRDFYETIRLKHINPQIRRHIFEFILLLIFGIFASPDKRFSGQAFLSSLILFYGMIYAFRFHSENILNKYRKTIILFYVFYTFLILIMFGIYLFHIDSHFSFETIIKISKIMPTMIILFWFLIKFIQFKQEKIRKILILIGVYSLIGFIAFHNHSATTKVMFLISPVFFFITKYLKLSYIKSLLYSMILFFVVIFPIFIFSWNIENFVKNEKIEPSFRHRICILKYTMGKIIENPISGNGLKSSRYFDPDTRKICFTTQRDFGTETFLYNAAYHPHNFIFQVLFEIGIFGILLLITMSKKVIKNLTKDDDLNLAVNLTIFICFFILLIFSYSLWESWLHGLIAFILITNLILKGEKLHFKKSHLA